MAVIARITKDGILSVAGRLEENPALVPPARFESDGTLHVRMLAEDPTLSKVEWGRDGIIRCKYFREGGLWTPPPRTGLYVILISGSFGKSYIIKLKLEDLSQLGVVTHSTGQYQHIATDGSKAAYAITSSQIMIGAKIDRDTLTSQIFSTKYNHNTIIPLGDYLYIDQYGTGQDNKISIYDKNFSWIKDGPVYSYASCSIHKDFIIFDGYFYLFDFYQPSFLRATKISLDLIKVGDYSATYLNSRPRHFIVDNNGYAYITGENTYGRIWKFHLPSLTLEKTVTCPHAWKLTGITLLNGILYICATDSSNLSPRIYKYDTNLTYLGHADFNTIITNGLYLITNDGSSLYAITCSGSLYTYYPDVLKLTPGLEVIKHITLSYINYLIPKAFEVF